MPIIILWKYIIFTPQSLNISCNSKQPAEKIIRNFIRVKLWPGTRPYKTENLYKYLGEGGETIANKNKTTGTASAKKHRTVKNK